MDVRPHIPGKVWEMSRWQGTGPIVWMAGRRGLGTQEDQSSPDCAEPVSSGLPGLRASNEP